MAYLSYNITWYFTMIYIFKWYFHLFTTELLWPLRSIINVQSPDFVVPRITKNSSFSVGQISPEGSVIGHFGCSSPWSLLWTISTNQSSAESETVEELLEDIFFVSMLRDCRAAYVACIAGEASDQLGDVRETPCIRLSECSQRTFCIWYRVNIHEYCLYVFC